LAEKMSEINSWEILKAENSEVVWQKVSDLLAPNEEADAAPIANVFKTAEMKSAQRQLRKWVRVVDVIAVVVWAYVLSKASFDFDLALVALVAPDFRWIVDYRVLFVLAVLAVLVLVFKKRKHLWSIPYIVAFPLVVLVWKLPRTLWRLGNWNLAFGVIHAFTSAVVTFRSTLILGAVTILSAVAVVAHWSTPSTIVGMLALTVAYLIGLGITIMRIFLPAKFIRLQRDAILKFSTKPGPGKRRGTAPKPTDVDSWTQQEATQFLTNTGISIMSAQGVYFWAYRLEQYRKSLVAYIVNPTVVFLLGIWTVAVVTVLTKGLHSMDSGQFVFADPPSGFTFFHYSLNACFFGEVDALKPKGDWAFAFHSASSIVMSGIILSLIPTFISTWRSQRSDAEADDAIAALKTRAADMARALDRDFGEDMDQLAARLLAFNWGLQGVLGWLMKQLPPDWHKQ
jgi:hypothetical protein